MNPIFAQASVVDTNFIHYLPILSTTIASVFTIAFCRRLGNIYIAGGTILPGIGGSLISADRVISIFSSQRGLAGMSE